MLIGKLISNRNFHAPVILEIVSKAWNPSRLIHVRKVDRNIFMFSFEHEADLSLAYKRRPWTIRGAHLNLKMWNPELSWQEIDFSRSSFWVPIHGLPPSWYCKEYIEKIGGVAGQVLEVDLIGEPRIQWQRLFVMWMASYCLTNSEANSRHLGDVLLHASVPTCKEQGTEIVRNCATEVSSFAQLLAHSFSGECQNNQDCPPHTTKEDSISSTSNNPNPLPQELLVPNPTTANTSDPTSSNLKRKEHSESPPIDHKNSKPNSPTTKATFFDPETVTITPQSQLKTYIKEKKAKAESRRIQFDISVDVLEFNFATVAINIRDSVCSWALVGFYSPPYYHKRRKAWINLCALLESFAGPWMCFGDFNTIIDVNEKEGGRSGSSSALNFLRNLMFDFGAVNLGFSGSQFTWCNRRVVLPNLISPAQSAFIPGRWITENQLIVQEILHSFKKRKVKGDFVALKLDLQKAYDRVNWVFLFTVLKKFGFSPQFIGWIMECISTVSFSVLVNGGKTKHFLPSWGLRQGDPLSPYLFILCQEVLSRLIDRQFVNGDIHGVKMNVAGPAFTHVMYADDIMVFSKANSREVQIIDECLETYCEWSGQYKLKAQLLGWRSKALSWAGRATMIRSVAMALPTYTFSLSDVPIAVCEKMDASIRRFWWKPSKEFGRYLAWRAWDEICVPKAIRGLDPWVPWLTDFLPKPKDASVSSDPMLVKNLINFETSSWRFEVLDELFDVESRDAISKIAIPLFPRPDKLTWIVDPKGIFSVKSAHWIITNHTWSILSDPIWKKLWKCKLHECLKILVWRIGSGVLPTNSKVFPRISQGTPYCPLCKTEVEMVPHLFFQCCATKMFWFGSCWGLRVDLLLVLSDFDVVKLVVNPPIVSGVPSVTKQTLLQAACQFALTLEAIWRFRNQVVHQSDLENPLVALKALDYRIMEYVQAASNTPNSICRSEMFWKPPPPGSIKLNVDAAILPNVAKIAVFARDEGGLMIKAWAKVIHSNDLLVAEASAILWAIQIAKMNNMLEIIVESDSKVCVDAITQDLFVCDWTISTICNDVRVLALEFISCIFCWVPREASMVVYTLAKLFPLHNLPVICFPKNLPTPLEEVWFRDFSYISGFG
uniref:Reverse transcriptase domain-containing protein n=1 Tax=Fagus sylvatica TaxID=28930 RepID=A0A2N9EZP9_FAGSY